MNGISMEEKQQIQLERLQSTLNRAYRNVPFHQTRFREMDMDPSSVSLEDLSKLPFMTREEMGSHYPYGLFAVPLRDIVRIHTAPGTTKNPSISGYTRHDTDIWRNIVSKALIESGVKDSDILQIHLNAGLANWGRDYQAGAEAIGAGVIPHDVLSIAKNFMVLRDYRTTVLVTTPGYARMLCNYMYASGFNPTGLALKTLVLAGEAVSNSEREALERQLHVKSWLHYGLSEIPGAAIGFECSLKSGIHVQEDHFIAEIISPETLRPCKNGEWGEIVLTTLSMRAFPLIRFRTGDKARILSGQCPCGSTHARIEWTGERSDDFLNIGGVKINPELVRIYVKEFLGFEPGFFETRQAEGDEPALAVSMAVAESVFSDEIKLLEKTASRLAEEIQESVGVKTFFKFRERSLFM